MRPATLLALLVLGSAGLLAKGQAVQGTAVVPPQIDAQSDYAPLAPWRTLFVDDKTTLGQVRVLFLNKQIVVGGSVEELGRSSQLLEWRIAAKSPESTQAASLAAQTARYFVPHPFDGLPLKYSGKTAQVIAIQWHDPAGSGGGKNALGQATSDDNAINPCFDLVAQFDDGTTAMTTQYPATLANASVAELVSVIDAAADRMRQELPTFAGKYVYAVGFTQLYRPDSTVEELANQNALKRIAPEDIPLLEPLEVVAASYADKAGVVIEVELPNGNKALSLTGMTQLFSAPVTGAKETFFDKAIGLFLSDMPTDLTKREVEAIRSGSIYRGMREGALEYVMGFPDKESKWGESGKQLTFRKSLVVYLSEGGRVEDWKFLDAK